VTIQPNTVYTIGQARALFGLRPSSLAREIRLGKLTVAKKSGRYFILGSWLLQWIENGALERKPVPAGDGEAG
jgi:hypothetical protein